MHVDLIYDENSYKRLSLLGLPSAVAKIYWIKIVNNGHVVWLVACTNGCHIIENLKVKSILLNVN